MSRANRTCRRGLRFVWLLITALVVAGCADLTPPAILAPSPQPTAAPAATIPDLPPAEIPRSKFLRFGGLAAEDGLSNDQVRGIVQDNHGFIWIATFDGLNRYDGSSIKVYRHDPDDPDSLSNNTVRVPIVDQNGDLWVGTFGGGLNRYDAENDAFIRYRHDPDDPHSLSNDIIRAVYEDRSGAIWVGTNGGLNKLDRDSEQFTRYIHDSGDPNSLSDNRVLAVFEDSTGVFWIGTEGGLNRFDPITEQFVHYEHTPDVSTSLSDNTVNEIREDSSGLLWLSTDLGLCNLNLERTRFTCYQHDAADPQTISNNAAYGLYVDQRDDIWVGTWGGGLNRFDRNTERFTRYQHHPADPYSVGSNNVDTIYEDRNGMLWISTDGGVSLLDGRAKPFTHYRVIPDDPNSLTTGEVRTLYVTEAGDTWVGTAGGGLSKFDHHTEDFTHYRHNPDDPNSLMGDAVWAIYEDGEGMMWVGSYGLGLSMFDPDAGRFTHYQFDPKDPLSLSDNAVTSMHEDQHGRFWIGTENGLNRFDGGAFTRYEHDPDNPQSLSSNRITIIYEDRAGELWIGTAGGLDKFSPEEGTFTRYHHDPANPESLGNNTVVSMVEDQTGNLWLGTVGGLDKFDREHDQFTHYTTADGLSSDVIFGILMDDHGLLWLGTSNGLSRFDPKTERFRNYQVSDGLQSDSFLFYSANAKGQNGELFFGGTNGFNAFIPDQVTDNLTPPPVVVTDFQLANRPVPIGGDSVLQASILETDKLVLSHQDNVFSFEFAALNYQVPEKNHYKYKMEGFEDSWNEVDNTRRFATYTNLDPGDYVFRVIAANNDNVWNEEGTAIKITITPPWWETTWFRIGLGLLAIGLLAGGYRWRVKSIEARNRDLETQVAQRTEELEAANQAKSVFLASMSHELRTPLNAILGFARLMSRDGDLNREQQERLAIINRSGEHLLNMVGDILTLSRIEAQRVSLVEERFDFPQMLDDLGRVFQSRAEGKGLRFERDLADDLPAYLLADAGKLRQVLINLLDNAVKFTQEGEVSVRVRTQRVASSPDTVRLHLVVEDSGPGIPRDRLDDIFGTFVRVEQPQQSQQGTGLGLAISKSLVEMMGGEIAVSSETGQGTRFAVEVPMLLTDGEAIAPEDRPAAEVIGLQPGQQDWRILVVDDNLENRLLLSSLLTQIGFTMQEAENGAEAVAKYQQWHPDLIWMDMRMPVMDGYAATQKIRALPGGDQVKIVAITASLLEESLPAVQEAGCDDVVLKPFRDHEIFDIMARELGAKFIYREAVAASPLHAGTTITAADLADLPPKLLAELRRTTLVADREATLEVIGQIEEVAPDTAANLRTLVEDFRMGHVRDLLKETETQNGN